MESKGKAKHKGWWIAGGLTTLFVLSQMGGADRTPVAPAPAPVAAYAAPQTDITSPDPEPLPAVDAPPEDAAAPDPVVEPEPEPDTADEQDASYVYYRNCSAARAAGVTPISEGEPGYARHLDRDGDGVACE